MPGNTYCSVHGCSNNSKNNSGLSFFRMPKNKKRLELWAKCIGREDILHKKNPETNRVCAIHFAPTMFINKRLKAEAMPALYLKQISVHPSFTGSTIILPQLNKEVPIEFEVPVVTSSEDIKPTLTTTTVPLSLDLEIENTYTPRLNTKIPKRTSTTLIANNDSKGTKRSKRDSCKSKRNSHRTRPDSSATEISDNPGHQDDLVAIKIEKMDEDSPPPSDEVMEEIPAISEPQPSTQSLDTKQDQIQENLPSTSDDNAEQTLKEAFDTNIEKEEECNANCGNITEGLSANLKRTSPEVPLVTQKTMPDKSPNKVDVPKTAVEELDAYDRFTLEIAKKIKDVRNFGERIRLMNAVQDLVHSYLTKDANKNLPNATFSSDTSLLSEILNAGDSIVHKDLDNSAGSSVNTNVTPCSSTQLKPKAKKTKAKRAAEKI